ncbi:MAG: hypothetical protein ACHQIH_00355, partial [Ignavibacteria bacterium]
MIRIIPMICILLFPVIFFPNALVNSVPSGLSSQNQKNTFTCDSSLWAHVYDPDRLILLQHC